jgi:FtsZ-binding cell division protein ZapB
MSNYFNLDVEKILLEQLPGVILSATDGHTKIDKYNFNQNGDELIHEFVGLVDSITELHATQIEIEKLRARIDEIEKAIQDRRARSSIKIKKLDYLHERKADLQEKLKELEGKWTRPEFETSSEDIDIEIDADEGIKR